MLSRPVVTAKVMASVSALPITALVGRLLKLLNQHYVQDLDVGTGDDGGDTGSTDPEPPEMPRGCGGSSGPGGRGSGSSDLEDMCI